MAVLLPTFQFDCSPSAVEHNACILDSYGWDLGAAFAAEGQSVLAQGSKFWSSCLLSPLLDGHPLWPNAGKWLISGISILLHAALFWGNHNSTCMDEQHIFVNITEEVQQGWQLPLQVWAVHKLPVQSPSDRRSRPMRCKTLANLNYRKKIFTKSLLVVGKLVNPKNLKLRMCPSNCSHVILGLVLLLHII